MALFNAAQRNCKGWMVRTNLVGASRCHQSACPGASSHRQSQRRSCGVGAARASARAAEASVRRVSGLTALFFPAPERESTASSGFSAPRILTTARCVEIPILPRTRSARAPRVYEPTTARGRGIRTRTTRSTPRRRATGARR